MVDRLLSVLATANPRVKGLISLYTAFVESFQGAPYQLFPLIFLCVAFFRCGIHLLPLFNHSFLIRIFRSFLVKSLISVYAILWEFIQTVPTASYFPLTFALPPSFPSIFSVSPILFLPPRVRARAPNEPAPSPASLSLSRSYLLCASFLSVRFPVCPFFFSPFPNFQVSFSCSFEPKGPDPPPCLPAPAIPPLPFPLLQSSSPCHLSIFPFLQDFKLFFSAVSSSRA